MTTKTTDIKETRLHEAMEDTVMIYGRLHDGLPFFAWSTKVDAETLAAEVEAAGPGNLENGEHGWEFHSHIQSAFEAMEESWNILNIH